MAEDTSITIEPFTLGGFRTNCFLVRETAQAGRCWVADVGEEPGPLLDRLGTLGLTPEAFVLTHAHVDHIAGLHEARRRFPGVPIWVHEREERWLIDAEANLSALAGRPVTAPPADRVLGHGDVLELAGGPWDVRHVPGHSPGSVLLYASSLGLAISGDVVFDGGVGRYDFPGSSLEVLERSIREQVYTLPLETALLPGHGAPTTVEKEMSSNPFVRVG